ncbi:hypothetical protein [Scytonema hofmannii]|uniref:hypothetical protein n=1 Tax=Scytonema hofmannii TaxID=34078 RepID=UPI0013141CC7|nr:hypothetical protein [Scytonema hofmannii]
MKVQSVAEFTTTLPTFKLSLENIVRSALSGIADIFVVSRKVEPVREQDVIPLGSPVII